MKIIRVCYEFPPSWDGLAPGPFEISLAQIEKGQRERPGKVKGSREDLSSAARDV